MNSIPQFGRRLAEQSARWSCSSCRRAQSQWQRRSATRSRASALRFMSNTASRRQQPPPPLPRAQTKAQGFSPEMEKARELSNKKNTSVMYVLGWVPFHLPREGRRERRMRRGGHREERSANHGARYRCGGGLGSIPSVSSSARSPFRMARCPCTRWYDRPNPHVHIPIY